MQVLNPGNLVPCYNNRKWQRHRQIGQDTIPYGLPAPNTRLIPHQFYSATGSASVANTSWRLVNAVDESEWIDQPSTILDFQNKDGGGFWVSWFAEEAQGFVVPPCGFWFVEFIISDVLYTFEVLHLFGVAAFEETTLQITGCSVDDALVMSVGLIGVDTLASDPVVSELIEQYDGADWVEIGTATADATASVAGGGPGSAQVRRTIVTQAGNTLTATYTLSWAGPCEGISFVLDSTTAAFSGTMEAWRITFDNENDKGTVLYQSGYTQQLYLEPAPVFNVPLIERDTETIIDGFGNEISRFTRTNEATRFEAWEVPDYALQFLSHAGDMSSIVLDEVNQELSWTLSNLKFTHRRGSPGLNIGEFQCDRQTEVYSGCQTDFALE